MGDSENSRSLLAASRQNLLTRAQMVLSSRIPADDLLSPTAIVRLLWRDWLGAWEQATALRVRQQVLEREMLAVVGEFPAVLVHPEPDVTVCAQFDSDIDRWLSGEGMELERSRAKEELAVKHRRWNEADADIGFEAALAAEAESFAASQELASTLWSLPASTHVDVIAKLHALLSMEQIGLDASESPWPQLRMMLDDLLHLLPAASTRPSKSMMDLRN